MHKKPKLILLINHRRHMRELLKSDLLYLGHPNVIEATSGKGGMKMIVEHSPDLVIIDLNIPDLLGITLFLNWFKALYKPPKLQPIKAVAISSSGLPMPRARVEAVGCDMFLPRSYQLEHLRTAVESA